MYPWGNDFVADNVVYSENSDNQVQVTGSKPGGVSWIGAYDLSGNVWEWVNDWYDNEYYATLAGDVVNPLGPSDTGDYRVMRGGSFFGSTDYLRATFRGWYYPSFNYSYYGFRCALSIE